MLKITKCKYYTKTKKLIHEALISHINTNSTLTEFVSALQDSDLRDALNYYTISGTGGFLFDSEEDKLSLSSITTFEIEELMHSRDQYINPCLYSYIFNRIEKGLDGSPTLLIDEAWIALKHPAFKDKIVNWLKV